MSSDSYEAPSLRVKLTANAFALVKKRFPPKFEWKELIEGESDFFVGQIIDYTHPYDDRRFVVRKVSKTSVLLDLLARQGR